MPSRPIPFASEHYYHVFNRGVDQMEIFGNTPNLKRFIKTMIYYRIEGPKPKFSHFSPSTPSLDENKKIVEIICYCLMPNHFHFLLRQTRENGITEFISKLSNSYTKYFNTKNKRSGPLLQGEFKAVYVGSNDQLLHVSRYIHLNPLVGFVAKDLESYTWSSYREYIGLDKSAVCEKKIILDQFNSTNAYKQFTLDQEDYGKKLEQAKHLLLDITR